MPIGMPFSKPLPILVIGQFRASDAGTRCPVPPFAIAIEFTMNITDKSFLETLREKIISNHFHPGEHLVERDIAAAHGVSRTLVRDAFKQLENDGLVRSVPNKGVFITSLTVEEIHEIYETRSILEAYASRLAIRRLTAEQVQRIEFLITTAADCVARNDYQEAHRHDQELHYLLVDNCGNRHISQMTKKLWMFVMRLRWKAFRIPGRSEQTVVEHKNILKALLDKDEERMESLIRHHVLIAGETLLDAAKNNLIDL